MTRAAYDSTTATGSGRDLLTSLTSTANNTGRSGNWGRSNIDPNRWVLVAKSGAMPSSNIWSGLVYSTGYNSNFSLAKTGVTPDGYDFIEDFSRFELGGTSTGANSSERLSTPNAGQYGLNNIGSGSYVDASSIPGGYDETYSSGVYFLVPVLDDPERDSLYVQNHNFETSTSVDLGTTSGAAPVLQSAASSVTSVPSFTTFSNPQNVEVEKISADRIRFRQSNVTQRVRSLSGNYSFSILRDNAKRNSFYLADHGLSNGQLATIETGSGGTLPTLATTVPKPTADGDFGLALLGAVKESLDIIKSSMGADAIPLYMNGSSAGTPFSSGAYTFLNGSYNFSYGMSSIAVNFENGLFNQTINLPSGSNTWSQELPFDYMQNTQWKSTGFNLFQSKFSFQQEAPYWITILEIPAATSYGGSNIQAYPIFQSSTSGMPFSQAATNNTNNTAGWTSLANGWRYTHDGIYFQPGANGGRHGFFRVSLILDNSGHSGYLSTYDQSIVNSSGLHASSTGYGGQRYLVDVLVPIRAGSLSSKYGLTSGSVTHVNSIASSIVNRVVTNLVAPVYSGAITSAFVKVVDNNRFSLKKLNNVPFDITNSGTSPLLFNLGTTVGALDGSYNILSSNNYSFDLQSSFKVPPRTLTFTSNNISNVANVLYFYIPNHSFDYGQTIEFVDSANLFVGLTSGANYYAIPADQDYFAIATSVQNAAIRLPINISPPSSGSYSFSSNTINGLIARSGTVAISSTTQRVTGSGDILFKQFFKDGDFLFVVNNTTTPGQIEQLRISSIVSDAELNLESLPTFSAASTKILTRTTINMRPDGTSLHRPFDGGVEMIAGSSPNSIISRQTRKYFRYQSGKGIQCSVAINFNPARPVLTIESNGNTVTIVTKSPHGIKANDLITIRGSLDSAYNGTLSVTSVTTFSFTYTAPTAPLTSIPGGIIEYVPAGWSNAAVRAGMFDDQNGFFYEYDGDTLNAVRRSAVQQLSGTVSTTSGENVILGINTNFLGQLGANDKIVVRGQTYKITAIESATSIHIQPSYRGISQSGIVATKVVDTRVAQSQWSLDKADGTGASGFNLDITKIQMAYMDYSWYGAGKIRFGFKDVNGKVRYFHEFIHNNKFNEAYMRSGNLPARYEIENTGAPSYVPSLFHWGTSVIMDGRFDDDKAYLFTASSNSLSYSSGTGSIQATTAAASTLTGYSTGFFSKEKDWYVRIPFNTGDASKFSSEIQLFSTNLNGQKVAFTDYANNQFNVYLFVTRSRNTPSAAAYPSVPGGQVVTIGAPVGGSSVDLDLLKNPVPIVTIRLAPSVDSNLTGALGQRDIINRMQLQLKQLGVTVSHDCDIQLILNGSLSTIKYESVQVPSLSQLIKHVKADSIVGGIPIFALRASGGVPDATGKRYSNTIDFDLSQISDLGNSILGGDGVFPNGPDILTIAAKIIDTTEITSTSPFRIAGRLTWTESQA